MSLQKTRLTKELREQIITNVIAATTLPERYADWRKKAVAAVRQETIDTLPDEFVAATRNLPKEWFRLQHSTYVSSFKNVLTVWESNWQAVSYFHYEPFAVPQHWTCPSFGDLPSAAGITCDIEQLTKERQALVDDLGAFLLSCRTVNQLAEKAPELLKHVPETAKAALLPVVNPNNLLSALTKAGFDRTVAKPALKSVPTKKAKPAKTSKKAA